MAFLMMLVLASCGETIDPSKDIKVCYVNADGVAIDITTGKSFTDVTDAPEAGYYSVAKDGSVKGEAEIKEGTFTSVTVYGEAVGFEGEVAFIENGVKSDRRPWGDEYCELYTKLAQILALYQRTPSVTFKYIEINGINYVLVDTIELN